MQHRSSAKQLLARPVLRARACLSACLAMKTKLQSQDELDACRAAFAHYSDTRDQYKAPSMSTCLGDEKIVGPGRAIAPGRRTTLEKLYKVVVGANKTRVDRASAINTWYHGDGKSLVVQKQSAEKADPSSSKGFAPGLPRSVAPLGSSDAGTGCPGI